MNDACLNKALQTLARRDHSCHELRQKLKACGFTKEKCQEVIQKCRRLGYLNDERFAALYLEQLQRKGNGIRKIEQKLHARGIPREIISGCVATHCSDDIELDSCRRALATKMRNLEGEERLRDIQLKLQRFLYGRGFSSHIVRQVMEESLPRKR